MKALTIVVDNTNRLKQLLRDLGKSEVLVGIPDEGAGRDPEPGEDKSPLSNAEIGYLQETGLPEKNIPARPFLVPGVRNAEAQLIAVMKTGLIKAAAGDANAADIALNKAGLLAVNAVKARMSDGDFVPLAPRTLAARKRRGRTGEKPLIDTSQLRNSITYVVVPKSK